MLRLIVEVDGGGVSEGAESLLREGLEAEASFTSDLHLRIGEGSTALRRRVVDLEEVAGVRRSDVGEANLVHLAHSRIREIARVSELFAYRHGALLVDGP